MGEARDRGLATLGAGRDEGEARRGLLVRIGELSVGLLSFYTWRPDYEWIWTTSRWGTMVVSRSCTRPRSARTWRVYEVPERGS